MNDNQRNRFFAEWWPRACATQHWDARDRAFRLTIIGQIVGRRLASCTELNNRGDMDRVVKELKRLADPENVDKTFAAAFAADLGARARRLYGARAALGALIAAHGPVYAGRILWERFKCVSFESETDETLRRICMTLGNRRELARERKELAPCT